MIKRLVRITYNAIKNFHDLFVAWFGESVLVLGDSHSKVFNHLLFVLRCPFYVFRVLSVNGATASGLENPNSSTKAYEKFKKEVESFNGKKIIVLLGEVDTGFVIWYRAKKYSENLNLMTIRAVDTYFKFIQELAMKFDVVVISCPLPTIEDNNVFGEVANARKEITVSQLDRTKLALNFNTSIQERCRACGISYLDLDQKSLGANLLVFKELVNKEKQDHHYNHAYYAKLIIDEFSSQIPGWLS